MKLMRKEKLTEGTSQLPFSHSFIHKYLNANCVPSTVLGTGDTPVNNTSVCMYVCVCVRTGRREGEGRARETENLLTEHQAYILLGDR